ncbi:MAG: ABC transporter permease subunit [Butyricicoccaceae bacterium]
MEKSKKPLPQRTGSRMILLPLLLMGAFALINLVLPLCTLLGRSVDYEPFWAGFARILRGATARQAVFNSLWIAFVSAALSVACAYFYAYIVEFKLHGRMQRAFRLISILPMLVPSVTHGIVITYLFGKAGIFTSLLGLHVDIYGPPGIIIGSFFYSFPAAFLIFSQAFASLDGRLFDNTRALGVGPVRRFFDITLPLTRYSIFSAMAVCFTMVFTDYGVPLSVGGTYPILPVLFYKNVIGRLDFDTGAIYSVLLLVPAVLVYLLDIFWFSKKQASTENTRRLETGRFHVLQKLGFVLLTAAIALCILVIVLVPFANNWPYDPSFTLRHFAVILRNGKLLRLLRTSLLVALGTALGGTAIAFTAGYLYVRGAGQHGIRKVVHGLYTATLAIPGLALGLAFALFFKGTAVYNTLAILVAVNIMHFFGSPYMMTISHFRLLDPDLEDICKSLGAGPVRTFTDVILPASRRLLIDVFSYFFTNAMITISAVSMLYTARTMTLAVQVTAFNDQGAYESAVAVSLVILCINILMKLLQNRRAK